MLICVFPLSMLFFFILFNILTLHDSKKYVIDNKTTTSPKPVVPGKHIKPHVITLLSLTLLTNTNFTVLNVITLLSLTLLTLTL